MQRHESEKIGERHCLACFQILDTKQGHTLITYYENLPGKSQKSTESLAPVVPAFCTRVSPHACSR